MKIREIIRSPSASVAIGLASALLMGSLATAGVNTLWVSRAMIVFSATIIISYILLSSQLSILTLRLRSFLVLIVISILFAMERLETWWQPPLLPAARIMPMPPLLMMLPIEKLGYTHPEVNVPGIPLAVTYVGRPSGGYAGFGKLADNANDDVMLGINGIEFRNLSPKSLHFSFSLAVDGEGKRFEIDGKGKGRWERQLNINDYFASTDKPRLSWLLSPIALEPYGTTSFPSSIGFVAPAASKEIRSLILRGVLPPEYSANLLIKDENTGVVARLRLPFGEPPIPATDPVSRMLREKTEGK